MAAHQATDVYQRSFNKFADCPVVDVARLGGVDVFWDLMRRDPVPRKLVTTADGLTAAAVRRLISEHSAWNLSNTMVTAIDHLPMLWRRLQEEAPMPDHAKAVDLYPMISFGRAGLGELRLAQHRHGTTAMHLLVGEKIWAFRPPGDPECARATGSCTLPFDVCAAHQRSTKPIPCVQRAGETVIFPDGWHHGTCNIGAWTVGWGGQGLRIKLDAQRCHGGTGSTCDGYAYSHAFAFVGVPINRTRVLAVSVARGSLKVPHAFPQSLLSAPLPWAIASYHAIQSALRSFVFLMMPTASRRLFMEDCPPNLACRDDVACDLFSLTPGATFAERRRWVTSPGAAFADAQRWAMMTRVGWVNLYLEMARASQAGNHIGPRLSFRKSRGNDHGARTLRHGEAAMWAGGQLAELVSGSAGMSGEPALALHCYAPIPADEAESWRRRERAMGRSGPRYNTQLPPQHVGIEMRDFRFSPVPLTDRQLNP